MTWWQFFIAVCRACLKKEGLAFFAFIGASGAGVAVAVMLGWNIWFLQREHRGDEIANLSYGLLVLFAVTQLSLHRLLGSKLAIEAEVLSAKLKLSQGEDDAA
jgi:uncharacterized membrane protein